MIDEVTRAKVDALYNEAVKRQQELEAQRLYKTGREILTPAEKARDTRIFNALTRNRDELQKQVAELGRNAQLYIQVLHRKRTQGQSASVTQADIEHFEEEIQRKEAAARGKSRGWLPIPVQKLREHSYDNIDPEIRALVRDLVEASYVTVASCAGHTSSGG